MVGPLQQHRASMGLNCFMADIAAMHYIAVYHAVLIIFIQSFLNFTVATQHGRNLEIVTLDIGKERENESLPLHMGQRIYRLNGLKQFQWYEVKVSYPASIPASFSIQSIKDASSYWIGSRRLLNTEKLIFKAKFDNLDVDFHDAYVLVTVEPAGVVAIRGVQEREYIMFNIVCDELLLGLPYKAWSVGMVAVLCLVMAFAIPYFLPRHFLPLRDAHESDVTAKSS